MPILSKTKKINILAIAILLGCSQALALDLNKMLKNLKEKSQQNPPATNGANPAATSNNNQTPANSSQRSGSDNTYQKQSDPSRESVKKHKAIILAKASGVPLDVKELVDGKERVSKADVLTESLSKAVGTVHPDLGVPLYNLYYTYSEFQKNITNPAYGLINKFDKTEKENIYTMMGQPDPQKNTWSVTVVANINTKLSEENYRKIKEDSRIIYAQSFGSTIEQARSAALLNAVQQYHQINLAPNTPVIRNMSNPNYGLTEKIEVINELQNQNTKLFISKIKVTLADVSKVEKSKFDRIKGDMEASRVKEPPNPVLNSLLSATQEVGAAQAIIENALSIKGANEMVKQDAYREKAGIRFGENDFQWQVGMSEQRWATIEERLKDNPKLDEQQKQEFTRGQNAMIPAYANLFKSGASIFTSLSSGGNPFQSLQALIQFPRLMAANSEGMNSLMTYNSNNGIDNTPMKDAKDAQGD